MIVECPSCGTKLSYGDDAAGKQLACPKCQHRFPAPGPVSDPLQEPLPQDDGGIDSFFDSPTNPYQQPTSTTGTPAQAAGADLNLSVSDVKKIEAIIKDAQMVALAVLLCLLCSGCGFIIIGPWYLARLIQWNGWATKCPGLIDPGAEYGSLQQRFQSAKSRLIIGLGIGAAMFVLVGMAILMAGFVG